MQPHACELWIFPEIGHDLLNLVGTDDIETEPKVKGKHPQLHMNLAMFYWHNRIL